LAFNSARTAGRFLTSKPKCFTPCVRKSSDGFPPLRQRRCVRHLE
jgi:hypothetical protein